MRADMQNASIQQKGEALDTVRQFNDAKGRAWFSAALISKNHCSSLSATPSVGLILQSGSGATLVLRGKTAHPG